MGYGFYYITVSPKAVAMYPMTLFDGVMDGPFQYPEDSDNSFFITNEITNIEEIQMTLKITEHFYLQGYGEELLNKTFVLTP